MRDKNPRKEQAMRLKSTLQEYFNFSWKSNLKEVRKYQQKYEKVAVLLAENPELLQLAHRDWSRKLSCSRRGRRADFTAEQILRVLVVRFVERLSYREVVNRIETSEFLRAFVGLGTRPMMDYSFLCKAMGTLSRKTVDAMNRMLTEYAAREGKIRGEKLRMDSTAYETNIHFPTDASLLWDGYRTLTRILRLVQKERADLGLAHRYHDRKVKKLAHFIARNSKSASRGTQRKVKRSYRKLIERVRGIAEIAEAVAHRLAAGKHGAGALFSWFAAEGALLELEEYLPTVGKIIDQAERRVLHGEKVPNQEKVFSLFEPHTELLIRGKAGKRIEFGHKVLVAQSEEKFITHYQVLEKNRDDTELLEPALDAHRELFGRSPRVLAADKGFYQSTGQLQELREEIKTVSIGKLGRRTRREEMTESSEPFKEGQRFRAGSEGSISVLKRAFCMDRCLFKGFKNYATSVGLAVLCHNLVLLARL